MQIKITDKFEKLITTKSSRESRSYVEIMEILDAIEGFGTWLTDMYFEPTTHLWHLPRWYQFGKWKEVARRAIYMVQLILSALINTVMPEPISEN